MLCVFKDQDQDEYYIILNYLSTQYNSSISCILPILKLHLDDRDFVSSNASNSRHSIFCRGQNLSVTILVILLYVLALNTNWIVFRHLVVQCSFGVAFHETFYQRCWIQSSKENIVFVFEYSRNVSLMIQRFRNFVCNSD